jgi:hypothetical protein
MLGLGPWVAGAGCGLGRRSYRCRGCRSPRQHFLGRSAAARAHTAADLLAEPPRVDGRARGDRTRVPPDDAWRRGRGFALFKISPLQTVCNTLLGFILF